MSVQQQVENNCMFNSSVEKVFKSHRGSLCEFHTVVRKANAPGIPNRSTMYKTSEMVLLLLLIQEDPVEGLKWNLFFVPVMGRTENNELRLQQGRFRLEIRRNFLGTKDPANLGLPIIVVTVFLSLPTLFLTASRPRR